jgi:hypothetical protein
MLPRTQTTALVGASFFFLSSYFYTSILLALSISLSLPLNISLSHTLIFESGTGSVNFPFNLSFKTAL